MAAFIQHLRRNQQEILGELVSLLSQRSVLREMASADRGASFSRASIRFSNSGKRLKIAELFNQSLFSIAG